MGKEKEFESEYILQRLTSNHLKEIFGLCFLTCEFQFKGFKINGPTFNEKKETLRLDGLAFDEKTNSFVILEYKNKKDENVIEQCKNYYYNVLQDIAKDVDDFKFKDSKQKEKYYKLLQDNKNGCIERYEKKFGEVNEENFFNFEKSKVMIIGPEFTESQINNDEKYIEIWKVSSDDGKVTYENATNHIKLTPEPEELMFTEDDTKRANITEDKKDNWDLYCNFKNKVSEKGMEPIFLVEGVSFRKNSKIICIINLKNTPKIHYFTDKFEDDEEKIIVVKEIRDVKARKAKNDGKIIVRDISDISTGGKANYEFVLDSEDELDNAFYLLNKII